MQTKFNTRIKRVERNGLCIIQSIIEVLNANGVKTDVPEVLAKLRTEIQRNIAYYREFSGAVDIETELVKFIADPVKWYANETVDLFIPALESAFKIKADVFSINATGKRWASTIGTLETVFARTTILHVDSALPIKHEVKTETNRPVFTCPLCYETFAGLLSLSRHLVKCPVKNGDNIQDVKPTKLFEPRVPVSHPIEVDLLSSDEESNFEFHVNSPSKSCTDTGTATSMARISSSPALGSSTPLTPLHDAFVLDDNTDGPHSSSPAEDMECNDSSDHFEDQSSNATSDTSDEEDDADENEHLHLTLGDHGIRAAQQGALRKIQI